MFSLKQVTSAWGKFFFEEKPTEGIAFFRMIWVGLIFIYFLFDLGNIADFYGPHGIVSLETNKAQFPYVHANIFHLFRPGYDVTFAIMIVYGISLFTSMIGLFTRTSLIVALILMTSLHQRNIWLLSSSELIMRLITFYLIFSPCGHTLSVDAFLFPKKRTWPVWSLRLIQIQISVIYLWTFWHKLKGESWIDGTAVYYATRLENLTNFSIPWLMDSLIFLKVMTWSSLIIEFSLGTLIWFVEFKKPLIITGIIFHLGIQYFLGIPFFEFFMMALLINFFTPEELAAFVRRSVNAEHKYSEGLI